MLFVFHRPFSLCARACTCALMRRPVHPPLSLPRSLPLSLPFPLSLIPPHEKASFVSSIRFPLPTISSSPPPPETPFSRHGGGHAECGPHHNTPTTRRLFSLMVPHSSHPAQTEASDKSRYDPPYGRWSTEQRSTSWSGVPAERSARSLVRDFAAHCNSPRSREEATLRMWRGDCARRITAPSQCFASINSGMQASAPFGAPHAHTHIHLPHTQRSCALQRIPGWRAVGGWCGTGRHGARSDGGASR